MITTRLFNLSGKVAIVTGAARGIGQSIAIELAHAGANVVVSDIIDGQKTVQLIKKMKRKAVYVKTDVSNKKDVEKLISETRKHYKHIDILVNNAGVYIPGMIENISEADWEKTMNINLKGAFLCSQAALKHMRRGGSIINISSIAGIEGSAGGSAYCASKGGIRLFTKALAAEVGARGIRVNSIHPGLIDTAMTQGISEKIKQAMFTKFLLKRVGKPIDIAGPVVFLASNASAYMTGSEIIIDGGWITAL